MREGTFIGPTIFDHVTEEMTCAVEMAQCSASSV